MHSNRNATAVVEHDANELVLERLPNGEHAWLRPEKPSPSTYELPSHVAAMLQELLDSRAAHPCAVGQNQARTARCEQPATRIVACGKPEWPTVELLCNAHADRLGRLDQVVLDRPMPGVAVVPSTGGTPPTIREDDDERREAGWREGWQHFTFTCSTTYTLFAPNLEAARAWFTDDEDIDIDSGPMEFGEPTLISIETSDGDPVVLPESAPAPDDDERYVTTDLGRRALAEAALFGKWPTVAFARLKGMG